MQRCDDQRDALRREDQVVVARLVEAHRVVQRAVGIATNGDAQAHLVAVGLGGRDADLLRGAGVT